MTEFSDFYNWNSWFEKYKLKPGGRYYTFKTALALFLQRNGRNIVETGCIKEANDWSTGMSTFIFGEFCFEYDRMLYTVDKNSKALEMAKQCTSDFAKNIIFNLGDSVAFLKKFDKPIDLLYLDSLDCPTNEDEDAVFSQKHALNELLAAYPKLGTHSVILIDDNDWKHGGKSRLVKRYLAENDWHCVMDERQSLWIKNI